MPDPDIPGSMTPLSEAARTLCESPEAFLESSRADMVRARAEVDQIKTGPPDRDRIQTLEAYDSALLALADAAARASLCRNVHPDPAMRDAADRSEQEVNALATELSLDRGLYDALASIDPSGLDPATAYFLEKSLRDFRRSGVDRDEATRARVKELRDELVRIGQEFGKNIKDDVRSLELSPQDLDGLPEDWRNAHPAGPDGKVTTSRSSPTHGAPTPARPSGGSTACGAIPRTWRSSLASWRAEPSWPSCSATPTGRRT